MRQFFYGRIVADAARISEAFGETWDPWSLALKHDFEDCKFPSLTPDGRWPLNVPLAEAQHSGLRGLQNELHLLQKFCQDYPLLQAIKARSDWAQASWGMAAEMRSSSTIAAMVASRLRKVGVLVHTGAQSIPDAMDARERSGGHIVSPSKEDCFRRLYDIVAVDVSSMYPSIVAAGESDFPGVPPVLTPLMSQMIGARQRLGRRSPQGLAIKLFSNSLIGWLGSKFCPFAAAKRPISKKFCPFASAKRPISKKNMPHIVCGAKH